VTRLWQRTDSILVRLIFGYVLVAAVFAVAWIWSLYGPLTQAALSQQQRNLTAVAQAAALVTGRSEATPAQIAQQLVARTDLRMTIVSPNGGVIADSNGRPEQMENHLDRPEVAEALAGRVGVARRLSKTEGREEFYVAVPASLAGQRVALRVSQPIAQIQQIAARSRRVGLLLLLAALVVAVAIAVRVTREATRPVMELSRAASRMAEGDLEVALPDVPADLQTLATALESLQRQMRARLTALEAEQLTLRSALDGLSDAVLVLEGNRIELANAAAGQLLRLPVSALVGADYTTIGLPAALASFVTRNLDAPPGGSAQLDPDPMGRVLRASASSLGVRGGASRTIISVADITEQARLDQVRRDFVANASHELKTPVAGIGLLAQSAETAAADGDVEQALAFARQIEAETARLQRLVMDLLDLSRFDSVPAPGSITDVRQTVDNAVISHRPNAERKGLALETDFSAVEGADVFVAADSTDVAIALDNLLDNAIAYTEAGSVRVRVNASAMQVTIAVADTGPGIAAEHHPRIFERFYRVDRGRSRDAGGTGLGLALVRHTVERNGGTVALDSEVGTGTTFTVALPRAT
jgi:two-component system phosphate regulon sensor histidine kinase PhoR